MTCVYDTRWCGEHGIGRFAREIAAHIPHVALESPGLPMSATDPVRLSRSLASVREPGAWFLSPGYNAPLWAAMPYVLTVHDLNHIDRPENSSFLKRVYYQTVLRSLCARARAVLTVSEFSRQRIIDWFSLSPDKVFTVGNGVSSVFVPDGVRHLTGYRYVLCVSNRRGHKNELGALRAFATAGLPGDARLVFTGNPDPALMAHAQSLGAADRVVFSGRVNELELAALYRGALMLLFPSFYEGFGLPIVEAFASGIPVISSCVTSMPEIAGQAALLVDPHAHEEIAGAIRQLHDDETLRRQLIERGLDRVAAFSWAAVAARVRDAIRVVDVRPDQPLNWN